MMLKLDFTERGWPDGWTWGGKGYQIGFDAVTSDPCPLTLCMERIGPGNFGVASQKLPVSGAPGARIKLSGYIRTENVKTGWAGLWLRIDGPPDEAGSRPMLNLDNMRSRGPRGTTPRTCYEIEMDLPHEATEVALGAILKGDGRAWFDTIRVEADGDVLAQPEAPVKASYADWLMTDEELAAAPDSSAPDESECVTAWVRCHHHPIRSLLADSYDDLQFLRPLLQGKRIVQLGESGHGVAEFNLAKVRLVKFLHQELDFGVIAFESPLYECFRCNERAAVATPQETMRDSIFPVWHTEETLRLFEYVRATRVTDRPLLLAGFDVQPRMRRAARYRPEFFHEVAAAVNSEYATEVRELDLCFATENAGGQGQREAYLRKNRERLIQTYDGLAEFFDEHRAALISAFTDRPGVPLVARQTAWSLAQFVRYRTDPAGEQTIGRDHGMADNLDFLADELYPGKKLIVWGHNSHLRHRNNAVGHDSARTMGTWVAERRGTELYTVGLYMHRGRTAGNTRRVYDIRPPQPGSLESILCQVRRRYLFIDLSRQRCEDGSSWLFEPITAKAWGTRDLTMVLRDQYDGILFVDTATPPSYIDSVSS